MNDNYLRKVTICRAMLFALVTLCCFLYQYNLSDYVILISIVILFFGVFTLSNAEVTNRNVTIRRNYFWGLIGLRWTIDFGRITSVKTKKYTIETHEDAWMLTESIFSFLIIDALRPNVKWTLVKLSYMDNGIEKHMELKLSKDDYREIERNSMNDKPGI